MQVAGLRRCERIGGTTDLRPAGIARMRPPAGGAQRRMQERGGQQRDGERPAEPARQHGVGEPESKEFGIGAVRQHGFHRVGRGERRPPARSRDGLGPQRSRRAKHRRRTSPRFWRGERTNSSAEGSERSSSRQASSIRPPGPGSPPAGQRTKESRSKSSSSPRRAFLTLAAAAFSARRRRHAPDQGAAAWTRLLRAASAAPAVKAASAKRSLPGGAAGEVSWRAQPGNGLSTGTAWDVPSHLVLRANHSLA